MSPPNPGPCDIPCSCVQSYQVGTCKSSQRAINTLLLGKRCLSRALACVAVPALSVITAVGLLEPQQSARLLGANGVALPP